MEIKDKLLVGCFALCLLSLIVILPITVINGVTAENNLVDCEYNGVVTGFKDIDVSGKYLFQLDNTRWVEMSTTKFFGGWDERALQGSEAFKCKADGLAWSYEVWRIDLV